MVLYRLGRKHHRGLLLLGLRDGDLLHLHRLHWHLLLLGVHVEHVLLLRGLLGVHVVSLTGHLHYHRGRTLQLLRVLLSLLWHRSPHMHLDVLLLGDRLHLHHGPVGGGLRVCHLLGVRLELVSLLL